MSYTDSHGACLARHPSCRQFVMWKFEDVLRYNDDGNCIWNVVKFMGTPLGVVMTGGGRDVDRNRTSGSEMGRRIVITVGLKWIRLVQDRVG